MLHSRWSWSLVTAFAVVATCLLGPQPASAQQTLELSRGDRICLIGNTLAERMQHFAYFETLLHSRFPQHELYVRNLGYSADELTLRPRSQDFGSPHEHLARHEADVVLAFFGLNESFAGEQGLEQFRADLAEFITETRDQQYNGESAPTLVLISPIAAEDLDDPRLPSADDLNKQIAMYTEAMREVAAEHDVQFVDVFSSTRSLLADADEPHTINGIHLNDAGYRALAPVLDRGLFGSDHPDGDLDERMRQELLARNECFYYSYRAVNGYYIYGGRSTLRFPPDESISNADVMERERQIWEEMAANHDRRVWYLAQGVEVAEEVDHGNLSPQIEVGTNFNQEVDYLSGEEALETFRLPEGYEINLFASEEQFPELANPMAIKFDGRGRLWVLTMPLYPQLRPDQQPQGRLLVFEDADGDGRADHMTVFADDLHVSTGFELGDGGAYVAGQPDLLFLKDTDGDGKADLRRRVLHGFDSADSHHAISAFTWGPAGSLYFQEGIFHRSQVETPWGPTRLADGGVFRYTPQRHKLEVFIAYVFPNPWGHVFDRWGMNLVSDGTGPDGYYAGVISGYVPYPGTHQGGAPHYSVDVRPNGAAELVSSRHFPEDVQGDYLQTNVIGFQGIRQFDLVEDGAGVSLEHRQDLLFSSDPNFRPIGLEFGPDGALYLCDWYNPLIGHMQHSLRDPKRDHGHGRVYRITHKDRPLVERETIEGSPVAELLELLKAPEDRTVYNARRELRVHDDEAVFAALEQWEEQLDPDHPEYERHLLEVLWLHQARDVIRQDLLERLLDAEDFRVRASATRALRHWLDRVEDPYDLVERQIHDDHPRVRLEAVITASFLEGEDALDIVYMVENYEMDAYLEYALNETLRVLEPTVERAGGGQAPGIPSR